MSIPTVYTQQHAVLEMIGVTGAGGCDGGGKLFSTSRRSRRGSRKTGVGGGRRARDARAAPAVRSFVRSTPTAVTGKSSTESPRAADSATASRGRPIDGVMSV
jgi:hypothetical protein